MNICLVSESYYPESDPISLSTIALKKVLEEKGNNVVIVTKALKDEKQLTFKDNILHVPFFFSWPMTSLLNKRKIKKILSQCKFDVVHIQDDLFGFKFGQQIAKEFNLPIVYSIRNLYEYHLELKYNPFASKQLDRVARSISSQKGNFIVSSQSSLNYFKNIYPQTHMCFLPDYFSLEEFENTTDLKAEQTLRKKYNIPDKSKIILFIDFNEHDKNNLSFFNSLSENKYNDIFTCVILSKKPFSISLKHKKNIVFINSPKVKELNLLWKISHLYITLNDKDDDISSIIAAMASKTLILSIYRKNYDYLIKDNKTGFYFDNFELLLDKIHELLNLDNEALNNILSAAHKLGASIYSKESFYNKLLEIYEEAKRSNI